MFRGATVYLTRVLEDKLIVLASLPNEQQIRVHLWILN
jgi:hypothetical protein